MKQGIIPLAIGVLFCCSYPLWGIFYCVYFGAVIAILALIYILLNCGKPFSAEQNNIFGCLGAFLPIAIAMIAAYIWNDERYISPRSSRLHLYEDCMLIKGDNDIKKVSELEGFFHECFTDCERCEERRIRIRKEKIEMLKAAEREELKNYLQEQIERLNDGEDIREVKEDLMDEFAPEEDGSNYMQGVPGRYQ